MRRHGESPGTGGLRRLPAWTVAAAAVLAGTAALAADAPAAAPDLDPAYYPGGLEPPALEHPGLDGGALVRFALLLAFAAVIFLVANWVFPDTVFSGTNEALWSGLILGGGVAAFLVAALVPWSYVGFPLGSAVFAGVALAYVRRRNARVTPPLRVLTVAHAKRLSRRLAGRGERAEAAPRLDIAFLGYDAIPRRLEGESLTQERANLEVERSVHEAITRDALAMGILARPQKGEVRYRVGGEMVAGSPVEPQVAEAMIRAMKQLADLDPDQTRKPQEGRVQAVVAGRTYDLRIKTAGTVRGEQAAIRIRDQATTQLRVEEVGLSEDQVHALKEALGQRPGLVLLSGPRNCGLTTTLHACLRHFDRYVHSVVAFEPSIDLEVENVEHLAVDQEDGPVAAAEVRSRIHMEPDVVAFDGLCDADVAGVLAEAAEEHTVVLTLRAGDTSQALSRLVTLFGGGERAAGHLQVVVNQRLVRLLCPECKEAYRPNPEFLRKANLGTQAVNVLYRPPSRPKVEDGQVAVCPRCKNQRYVGRTGLFELMPIDEEARAMIARGALADLRTYGRKLGMRNLQEEGLRLVIDGQTSVEEVIRAIKAD